MINTSKKLCNNCFEQIDNSSKYSLICKYCKYNDRTDIYYVKSLMISAIILMILFSIHLFMVKLF